MRFERSREWWMARASREGDAVIGAGLLAFDPAVDERAPAPQHAIAEETRIAFGKFISLMRRHRGYSVEELAQAADLDAGELVVIEADVHYVPEPRTIFKLAETFDVSQRRLMQFAGLTAANDAGLRQEAVRFAARSESMQRLTPEENAALEAFVAVLSDREHKRDK